MKGRRRRKKSGDKERTGGRGGEGWRGGVMSCLWPERREGPRDMTDYRRGQSSRPMLRPELAVKWAGKGDVGHREGPANKKGRSW